MKSSKQFFQTIDYQLLRNQKTTLMNILSGKKPTRRDFDRIHGLLLLIDSIQDHVVDDLKLKKEEEVFNIL